MIENGILEMIGFDLEHREVKFDEMIDLEQVSLIIVVDRIEEVIDCRSYE
jgi:hypothetical protein